MKILVLMVRPPKYTVKASLNKKLKITTKNIFKNNNIKITNKT